MDGLDWSHDAPSFSSSPLSLELSDVEIALGKLESEGQILRGQFFASKEMEFCHRRILARIHRLTIGRLRQEIEPVTSAGFMRFLCRWQHIGPGTQLHGVDGLYQVLRQLQGYEISAAAWESVVLRRVAFLVDDSELLDRLCLAGEVMWGRLSPHPALEVEGARRVRPTRVAPLAIFLRADAQHLLMAEPGPTPLSPQATDVLAVLEKRGASFFNDIVRTTGRLASEVEDGLWELVAAGLVTADGFENLRSLVDPKRRRGEGRGRMSRPRHATGRWAVIERTGDSSPEFFARQLLDRWGVVFRDLLVRETLAPAWRDLLVVLRRMEARGEIRGGRFVSGFVGEQFARPEAVDLLRHIRRSAPVGEEIEIYPRLGRPAQSDWSDSAGSTNQCTCGRYFALARWGGSERADTGSDFATGRALEFQNHFEAKVQGESQSRGFSSNLEVIHSALKPGHHCGPPADISGRIRCPDQHCVGAGEQRNCCGPLRSAARVAGPSCVGRPRDRSYAHVVHSPIRRKR